MFLNSNEKSYAQFQIELTFFNGRKIAQILRIKSQKQKNCTDLIPKEIELGQDVTNDFSYATTSLADKIEIFEDN